MRNLTITTTTTTKTTTTSNGTKVIFISNTCRSPTSRLQLCFVYSLRCVYVHLLFMHTFSAFLCIFKKLTFSTIIKVSSSKMHHNAINAKHIRKWGVATKLKERGSNSLNFKTWLIVTTWCLFSIKSWLEFRSNPELSICLSNFS